MKLLVEKFENNLFSEQGRTRSSRDRTVWPQSSTPRSCSLHFHSFGMHCSSARF